MSFLDSIEHGLERVVNGAFAKTFRSGVQPIEIAAALKSELDSKAQVISRDRVVAPNELSVLLSQEDYNRLSQIGSALPDELADILQKHAKKQNYQFLGGLSVTLTPQDSLSVGVLSVTSSSVKGNIVWTPVLEIAGNRYPITSQRTVIGRSSSCDIPLADTGVSKQHVMVAWDGSRAAITDLGSTNGTTLNGQKVSAAAFPADSIMQVGRTQITLRIIPQSAPERSTERG